MMTVGIVNDLRTVAESLRRMVSATPGFSVRWVAASGEEAIAMHRAKPADIVLMDLVMPGMNGADATEAIMKAHACVVLVVTATITGNRELVFAAMGKGALDAVNTPEAMSEKGAAELRKKLTTVGRLVRATHRPAGVTAHKPKDSGVHAAHVKQPGGAVPVIAIGASTGGPQAVAAVLRELPAGFPAAVVVVQHLDRQFVAGFAKWLEGEIALRVHIAREDELVMPGTVYLAESDHHLAIRKSLGNSLRLHYVEEPLHSPHRPSVDVFFASLSQLVNVPRCALLLTGMGADGAKGLLALKQASVETYAQDEASSVVYGMPAAALKMSAVDVATPLREMAQVLRDFVKEQQ